MPGDDFEESYKPRESAEQSESSLSTAVQDLERESDPAALRLENQENTSRLVNDGVLPQLDFVEASSSPARAETKTEYSNGVRTTRTEGETVISENGNVITIEPSIMIDVGDVQPQPCRQELDKDGNPTGTILDGDGKPVARSNDDGSVSVFERDADGRVQTTTEFPNGVKITTGEPRTETRDGRTITIESNMVVVPEGGGWQQRDDGTLVNRSGDTIRTNDDGSVTMTTRDEVITQRADGTITRSPKTAGTTRGQ
ncbi:MAG TPA: hypothetical protein V6D08_08755 [Candidatus Obscuribacterales bacterium]